MKIMVRSLRTIRVQNLAKDRIEIQMIVRESDGKTSGLAVVIGVVNA